MSKTSPNEELMTALTLHYDALVEYIRLRFNGKHFARDLVHDVCIQILEKPPKEKVALPLAFLRKVSFNRAVDRIRAERTRSLYVQTHMSPEEGMDSWDGARAVEFEQHVRALLAIIEALPARQRQIFLLHRIHGMPQREIADELGISLNMVNQHFGRAMAAIIQRWEPARRLMQRREQAQR